ncbi:transposase [Streptomyces coeruleorubidus]|uniref:transposase n=1 Tax=Streptomyces coeruleorubidus TaxID=116188 RepID=UPI0036FEB9AF
MARLTRGSASRVRTALGARVPARAPGTWASSARTPRPASRVRAEQQTPEWKARYAVRFEVEGTINGFAHGHGMRHCRYRGQPKAHRQHVLTVIAVNIERFSGRPAAEEASSPRPPTAFQTLDQHQIPRPKSWRTLGT